MSATLSLKLTVQGLLDAAADIGTVSHNVLFQPGYNFADGTGADQIKQIFTDTRTLSASSSEDLDLAGGLTNALGAALTFTKIRLLLIRAAVGNTNNVIVGGAASNQFVTPFGAGTHTLTIRPGSMLVLVANDATGYAVTASTGDLLKVANSSSGSSVSYDIVIAGTTA